MTYVYKPIGVCSSEFSFEIEDNLIKDLHVLRGCDGNLKGISNLLIGRSIDEIVPLLKGITCGPRKTSCPDQIATALEHYLEENK